MSLPEPATRAEQGPGRSVPPAPYAGAASTLAFAAGRVHRMSTKA